MRVLVYDSAYSTVDEKISSIISNLFLSDNIVIKHSKKQHNVACLQLPMPPPLLMVHLLRTHLIKCFDEGMTLFHVVTSKHWKPEHFK